MANQKSKGYDWVQGVADTTQGEMHKTEMDTYSLTEGYFQNTANLANNDFLVTAPLPGDVRGDIIVHVRRMLGSANLTLDMEYSLNVAEGDGNVLGEQGQWSSVTGAAIPFTISGSTTATVGGDWFKWDIAENGLFPLMRLVHKNETGGTISTSGILWDITVSYMRSN